MPPIVFYRDAREVESMIRLGMIDRPQIKINDDIIWRWPDRPVEEGRIARMRGRGKL
jgi:hypothetical protein